MSPDAARPFEQEVRRALRNGDRPVLVGLCGAQGSGKSTVANTVAERLTANGIAVAQLSLDDLYLTAAERTDLAAKVHPLLRTRGVPGTHDIALGHAVLDSLMSGAPTLLPRFDKAEDDRMPESACPLSPPDVRVILLEGWCVGASPQEEAALAEPVNALERDEDAEGRWRRHVNAQLAGPYQPFFARLDSLTLLLAPSFEIVATWRMQQEHALREKTPGGGMDDDMVMRFVSHYERLTRHIMAEMPGKADRVVALDDRRKLVI